MNTTTRTFPRTMEAAFGPGHRGGIWEPEPKMDRADRIVLIGGSIALAIFLVPVLVAMVLS